MHKKDNFSVGGGAAHSTAFAMLPATVLLTTTMLAGAGLLGAGASATTGTASDTMSESATVTVSESCSMTATINTAHSATVTGGTYTSGIGQTTIQTFCNDPSGYAIYAVGYTGNTKGTTTLHSNTLGSTYDIATGTAQSGSTSNWAMKLGSVSGTYAPTILNGFSSYSAVPSSYTKVASYGSLTDATTGSSITTTYAAYVTGAQPAGTYEGQVKYTLVHPAASDAPDADTLQNVAYWGGELKVGDEVTTKDARDGKSYTVARLCTSYTGTTCNSSELWMTENLDLTLSPNTTLTSLNTDLNEDMGTSNGYSTTGSIISWKPSSSLTNPATISDFSYSSSATSVVSGWTNSYTNPYQAEGTLSGSDVYIYSSGSTSNDTIYTSLSACTAAGHTAADCAHYKVGNYYNWTAAVAMNDTSSYNTQYTVMPNSICPSGWRLPNGLTSDGSTVTMSDFNKLMLAQNIISGTDLSGGQWYGYQSGGFSRMNGSPLYFARSGRVNGTTLYHSSNLGYYWSSTVQSSSYAYYLSFDSGGTYPASQYNRNYGWSVRCVAR